MTTYAKDELDGLWHKCVSVENFQVAAEDSNGDCQEYPYTLVKDRQVVPRTAFDCFRHARLLVWFVERC
jgi:hypothetical protein